MSKKPPSPPVSKSTKYRKKLKASTAIIQGSSESDSSDFETPPVRRRLRTEDIDKSADRLHGLSREESDIGTLPHQDEVQLVQDANVDSEEKQVGVSDTSSTSCDNSDRQSDCVITDEEHGVSHSDDEESEFYGDEDQPEEVIDQPEDIDLADTPLYEGAPLTVIQSVFAIMTLCLTHALTGQSVADILTLIAIHCPSQNLCTKTLYKFKKFFLHVGQNILVFHHYCSGCFDLLPTKDAICQQCGEGYDKCYFIEIPIMKQLNSMLKRPGFVDLLQYRFTRRKSNESNIEDIYDGKIYKEHFDNNGFLSNPHNISMTWYSDGVSIFKSSKFSVWPLYFMINELSYKNRVKQENIMLAGLWFGPVKPKVNTFFRPFHTTLQYFKSHGYMFQVHNGPPIRVKGMLLSGTCDLPAKAAFLRFTQYNGLHGCVNCKTPGQRFSPETNVHVYPYSPVYDLRANEEVLEFAREAVVKKKSVYGVKGPSLLYYMVPNMVWSTAIDVMHGVFLGVCKLLTLLWFDSSYKDKPFSLYQMLDVVDEKLQRISPPSFVPRMPRKIRETLAFWKALEFKLWLLYYSIPTLIGIMDPNYLEHHIKLVSAIYLLNQRSISLDQIDVASQLLHEYVRDFQELYDLRFMGMNIHQLLHFPETVLNLGPLWVHSCFIWEDLNGRLTKMFHGSRYVGIQICSSVSVLLNLASLINQLDPQSDVRNYCEKLLKVGPHFKIAAVISEKVYAVGSFKILGVEDTYNIRFILNRDHGIFGGLCQIFDRVRKDGVMYFRDVYLRPNKKRSSFVAFEIGSEPKLGNIKQFIRWSQCECTRNCNCPALYFCIIEVYERLPWLAHDIPNIRLSYMNKVQRSDLTVAVRVSSLQCLCYYVAVIEGTEAGRTCEFIIKPVNTLETE